MPKGGEKSFLRPFEPNAKSATNYCRKSLPSCSWTGFLKLPLPFTPNNLLIVLFTRLSQAALPAVAKFGAVIIVEITNGIVAR